MYNAYGLNEKRVLELPFAAPSIGILTKNMSSMLMLSLSSYIFHFLFKDFFSYISTC